MTTVHDGTPATAPGSDANFYLGNRDLVRSKRHDNDVALCHPKGTSLSKSYPLDRDLSDIAVTSALIADVNSADPMGSWPDVALRDELVGVLDSWLGGSRNNLIEVRRRIHAHPELSGGEFKTTQLVRNHLEEVGLLTELLPG